LKKAGLALLVLVGVIAGCGLVMTFMTPRDLYVFTKAFAGCPSRPSCVSSVATDEVHAIAPLRYHGSPDLAWAGLLTAMGAMPGARIAHQGEHYLHLVFQTPVMHYHDDVELLVTPNGVIDVRSISRFGYRDMGVNRKRVEEIRSRFDAVQGRRPGSR
jgi:uncharacterized protein (DUF1499 family)